MPRRRLFLRHESWCAGRIGESDVRSCGEIFRTAARRAHGALARALAGLSRLPAHPDDRRRRWTPGEPLRKLHGVAGLAARRRATRPPVARSERLAARAAG